MNEKLDLTEKPYVCIVCDMTDENKDISGHMVCLYMKKQLEDIGYCKTKEAALSVKTDWESRNINL